jgi:DNA-directed RNA polymerase specialized sigma24 family protein
MSTSVAVLPNQIEDWTQEQRNSLLLIAKRTLAGYGKYQFSREFIARHIDDFVQDALLQAWASQQDPEAEALRVYNPAGFVSFKVIQLALDKAKGEKRRLDRAAPEGVTDEPSALTAAERISDPVCVEDAHEVMENLEATKLAMAQLPKRQRVAFVKCQLEGRSQSEVARELSKEGGKSVSRKAVERLVANARVGLAAAFAKVASGAFCEEQRHLLDLADKGLANPEQEFEAHAHLKDCSQCAQVRAFARFERETRRRARGPAPAPGPAPQPGGMLDVVQHWTANAGERVREVATHVWRLGEGPCLAEGPQAMGISIDAATASKAG